MLKIINHQVVESKLKYPPVLFEPRYSTKPIPTNALKALLTVASLLSIIGAMFTLLIPGVLFDNVEHKLFNLR